MTSRLSHSPPSPGEGPTDLAGWARVTFTVLLIVIAVTCLLPLWLPLTLAAWSAHISLPLTRRFERRLHGRTRAASVVTVLLLLFALLPLVFVVLSLAGEAARLVELVSSSPNAKEAIFGVVGGDANGLQNLSPRRVLELLQEHGMNAVNVASSVFGITATAVIGVLVYTMGVYAFLAHARSIEEWFVRYSPLRPAHTHRFISAFHETGRGLLLGTGLTALLQGGIAAIGYAFSGVPHPLVFGLLTAIAALIPGLGTGLVWGPIVVVLFLSDDRAAAIAVTAVGVFVSIADNFVRPVLSRWGKLDLPTFVVFLSMLGGIAAFGAAGLLSGPLFVRLAVEALRIHREARGATPEVSLDTHLAPDEQAILQESQRTT